MRPHLLPPSLSLSPAVSPLQILLLVVVGSLAQLTVRAQQSGDILAPGWLRAAPPEWEERVRCNVGGQFVALTEFLTA